jgi:hypothetical protein
LEEFWQQEMAAEPEIDGICVNGLIPVEQRRYDQSGSIIHWLTKPLQNFSSDRTLIGCSFALGPNLKILDRLHRPHLNPLCPLAPML